MNNRTAHGMITERTASLMYGSIVLQEHWQLQGHLLGSRDRQKTENTCKIGDGPLRVNDNQKEFSSLPGSEGSTVEHSDFLCGDLVLTCHLSF